MGLKTGISWCDSTLNPTWGCDAVSPGCDNCYAERLAKRLRGHFNVTLEEKAISPASMARLGPIATPEGPRPRLVFVNSMSDLWHAAIPEAYLDRVFAAFATQPFTVFQVLTKRPTRMRRYLRSRFKASGVPTNVWLGVSVEDDRVEGRVGEVRRAFNEVGAFTAFVSIEPLIGPVDGLALAGIDWAIVGGESGPRRRHMREEWVRDAIAKAWAAGAAVWFKQWGAWPDNPSYQHARRGRSHDGAIDYLVGQRFELAPDEKGGATLDGKLIQELPESYYELQRALRGAML